MRSAIDLVDLDQPAWPLVASWLAEAKHPVDILAVDRTRAIATLEALQVTTRSPLGAIAWETGGLLVDHGWLRILGSGAPALPTSLATANGLLPGGNPKPLPGACLIAWDVLGGLFAVNIGAFDGPDGRIFYCGPDTLAWDEFDVGYSLFLQWAFSEDLQEFYADQRWSGWQADVTALSGELGLAVSPSLLEPAPPAIHRQRTPVPIFDLSQQHLESATTAA